MKFKVNHKMFLDNNDSIPCSIQIATTYTRTSNILHSMTFIHNYLSRKTYFPQQHPVKTNFINLGTSALNR